MSTLKLSAAALCIAVSLPASGFAADIKFPTKAPALVAVHNWNGFYAGVNAGYGWGTSKTDYPGVEPTLFIPGQTFGAIPRSNSPRNAGFIGGVQAGYNWQFNSAIAGLEADFAYTGMRGTATYAATVFPAPLLTTTQENKLNWFATVRPRVGMLLTPDFLGYVTGGVAIGGAKAATTVDIAPPGSCPLTNGFCSTGSASKTLVGWTAGLGAEMALAAHWTAKAEYLYYDLGNVSYQVISTATFGNGGTESIHADAKFKGHIVRVGLNYSFN